MFGFSFSNKTPQQQAQPKEQPKQDKPTPSTLGSGMASKAAQALVDRRRQIEEAANYADGGLVRGKGTGTSDDIPAKVEAGSFILPADSTKKLMPEQLAKSGKRVDVNLSNGEFHFTPEQIYQLGLKTLEGMREATHQPINKKAGKGLSFANGGLVNPEDDANKKRALSGPSTEANKPNASSASAGTSNNNAFNNYGQNYSAADQTRARAKADSAAYRESLKNQPEWGQKIEPEKKGPLSKVISKVKGVGLGGLLNGAYAVGSLLDARNTEEGALDNYTKRFGLEPLKYDGTEGLKAVGLSALGYASDLADSMTGGIAGRLYADKQEQAEKGEQAFSDATIPAAIGGAYGAHKAAPVVGKALDTVGRVITRGKYKGDLAEKALSTNKGRLVAGAAGAGFGLPVGMAITATDPEPVKNAAGGATNTESQQGNFEPNNPLNKKGLAANYRLVDGVPFYDNSSVAGFDPKAMNTMPASAVMGLDPALNEQRAAAFKAAAERGDWAALERAGAVDARAPQPKRDKVIFIEDTSQEDRYERALKRIATERPRDIKTDYTSSQRQMYGQRQLQKANAAAHEAAAENAAAANEIAARDLAMREENAAIGLESSKRINNLYKQFETAKTPEERSKIATMISQLSGKGLSPKDKYLVMGGGQEWNPEAGALQSMPQRIFNAESGEVIGEQQKQPVFKDGIYIDANGNKQEYKDGKQV